MMKLHSLLGLGVGGALLVPAAVFHQGDAGGLEAALLRTVEAIEHMSGIRAALQNGDPGGIEAVLAASEPPLPAGIEREAHLARLRDDVGRLVVSMETTPLDGGTSTIDQPPHSASDLPGSAHVGLDEATINMIGGIRPPVEAALGAEETRVTTMSRESDGFIADPLRLGRSYYLADRFAEGLEILRRIHGDLEARYWSGRCLEKLGRTTEAIAAYEEVATTTADAYLAGRARNDLEFLRWRDEFERSATKREERVR